MFPDLPPVMTPEEFAERNQKRFEQLCQYLPEDEVNKYDFINWDGNKFEGILAAAKILFEEKQIKPISRFEKAIKEQAIKDHNEKVEKRGNKLVSLGFTFNGDSYIKNGVPIYGHEVANMNEKDWDELIEHIKDTEKKEIIRKTDALCK